MGLAGCWTAAVAFQAIRLALNGARLLRRNSVLSKLEPLPDALADVEARLHNQGDDVDGRAAAAAA